MYTDRRKGRIMSVLRQVGRAVRRAPSGAFHRGGGALVLAVAGAASSLLFGCAHGGSGTNQSYGTSGDDSGAGDPGAADAAIGVSSGGGGEAGAIGATDATSPGVEAGRGTDAWTSGEGGPPAPSVVSKQQVCKLINGQSEGDPTANQAPSLADLNGTELGIPIDVVGELYFFFGDTHGK